MFYVNKDQMVGDFFCCSTCLLIINLLNMVLCFPTSWQVDRVYLSSLDVIAVLDHERKRTFTIRRDGLPDVGETSLIDKKLFKEKLGNFLRTW